MLESRVWRKYDPRYLLEYFWEEKQKKYAEYLIPVANNYKRKLIGEGVKASKIEVVPCTVNLDQFSFDDSSSHSIKARLNCDENSVTGVYVGKFGGLYYDSEAFACFKQAADYWDDKFRLIILTPQDSVEVRQKCIEAGLSTNNVIIEKVAHHEIPKYLNVADFAFTFYKLGESKQYLSPIKVGEYWACGLPVLISEGIGDDAEIITREEGGLVVNQSLNIDFIKLEELITKPKEFYRKIAVKYRNPEIDLQVYKQVLF